MEENLSETNKIENNQLKTDKIIEAETVLLSSAEQTYEKIKTEINEQPNTEEALQPEEQQKLAQQNLRCVKMLPPAVLLEINQLIDDGWRSKYINSRLRQQYANSRKFKLPSQSSLYRYIDYYLAERKKQEEVLKKEKELFGIQESLNKETSEISTLVSDQNLPKFDKRAVLEGVIRKSISRIQEVEQFQRGKVSPNFETCITKYLSVLRDAVETLAKYEGEMASDESIIINIVDNNVQELLRIFHKLIKELAPDRASEFQNRLKEEIDLYRKELTVIKK